MTVEAGNDLHKDPVDATSLKLKLSWKHTWRRPMR